MIKILQFKMKKKYAEKYAKEQYNNLKEHEKRISNLNLILKNKIILDLASGGGQYTLVFDKYSPKKIICHDKFKIYLDLSKRYHQKYRLKSSIKYVNADMMDLNYKKESIDLIFCNVAFFYAKDEILIMKRISKILKNKGYLVLYIHDINKIKNMNFFSIKKYIYYFFYHLIKYTNLKLFPIPAQNVNKIKKYASKNNLKLVTKKQIDNDTILLIFKKNE